MPAIDPLLPIPAIVILFGGAFLFMLSSYKKIEKGPEHKRTLLFLRLLSVLVLLIVTLRPRLEYTEEKTQKDKLYFLYDRSSSMTIRDMPGRKNRLDYMDSLIYKNKKEISKLKDTFELKEYSFANDLEKSSEEVKSENSTAIGTALYKTAIDSRIRKVRGLVLLSDGINTGGSSINRAVSELKRRNIPVYSVMIGQNRYQENIVDGVISELDCPQSVKRGKPLIVDTHGIARGLRNYPVKMELLIDDKVIKEIEITPDNKETHFYEKVEINIDRFEPGYRKLTARLKTGQREISPANNILDTYFQIKEGGIKVLLLATSPSPDFKFVNRILNKMEDLTVTVPNPFLSRTDAGKKELSRLKPEEFDVIILINPDLNLLPIDFIQKCEAFMKARKQGLFVMGETLLKSLFEKNLLKSYLPVTEEAFSFARKNGKLTYTKIAEEHFITQFFEKKKDMSLAGISGRISSLKPSISAKTLIEQDKAPILVIDQYQRCRVAWLNTDGLWQWMTDPTFKSNYQQLWKRVIYHLAHREADLSAKLAIFTDNVRYETGDKVNITADFLDEKGTPVTHANIKLLATPDKEHSEEIKSFFSYSRSLYTKELIFRNGGLYSINASTEHKGEKLESNEVKVFIQEPRTEFERILADDQLMEKLAEVTGGENIKPEEFSALLDKLQTGSKVRSVRTVTAKKDAWDNIFTYLIAALFLSIEWFKRRRIGLA